MAEREDGPALPGLAPCRGSLRCPVARRRHAVHRQGCRAQVPFSSPERWRPFAGAASGPRRRARAPRVTAGCDRQARPGLHPGSPAPRASPPGPGTRRPVQTLSCPRAKTTTMAGGLAPHRLRPAPHLADPCGWSVREAASRLCVGRANRMLAQPDRRRRHRERPLATPPRSPRTVRRVAETRAEGTRRQTADRPQRERLAGPVLSVLVRSRRRHPCPWPGGRTTPTATPRLSPPSRLWNGQSRSMPLPARPPATAASPGPSLPERSQRNSAPARRLRGRTE